MAVKRGEQGDAHRSALPGPHLRYRLTLVAAAGLGAVVPLPPGLVERYYSESAFPVFQRGMTGFSNLVAVALIDIALVGLFAWLVFDVVRTVSSVRKSGWRGPILAWLGRLAVAASVVYIAFFLMWGLNYRRVPLIQKVRFDPAAASPQALMSLAIRSVSEVNRLHSTGHAGAIAKGSIDEALARAFEDAQRAVGVRTPARPARPKFSILDVYFKAAGVEGMTDPVFLETLVVGDLLPFERPLVIAHEWSHLAGFANEGEANFLGWLTCMRGSDAASYSGWLFLYGQLSASLGPDERKTIAAQLAPGPRADLVAIGERVRRHLKPVVADAGWRVYDRYLKANRVDAGTASYAEVVRLVLGVRLDPA